MGAALGGPGAPAGIAAAQRVGRNRQQHVSARPDAEILLLVVCAQRFTHSALAPSGRLPLAHGPPLFGLETAASPKPNLYGHGNSRGATRASAPASIAIEVWTITGLSHSRHPSVLLHALAW